MTTQGRKKQTKKSSTPENATQGFIPKKAYPFKVDPDDRDKTAKYTGQLAIRSTVAASRVIVAAEGNTAIGEILDVHGLIAELREQAVDTVDGDLSEAEAMLVNQATALQSLFVRLVERGMSCQHAAGFEVNFRMALRAQGQCRATLETLAEIKSPRAVFVRQQNIANGPQQVNNCNAPRAGETETGQNKLSGGSSELLPDSRALQASSRIDTPVGALAALDRAEVAGR